MSSDAAQPPRATVTWRDWLPLISLVLVLAGLIWAGGAFSGQLKDNTRRVEMLERRADAAEQRMTSIEVKLAGMDGKLDLLLERVPKGSRAD